MERASVGQRWYYDFPQVREAWHVWVQQAREVKRRAGGKEVGLRRSVLAEWLRHRVGSSSSCHQEPTHPTASKTEEL
eukprot:1530312-Amphidinium_carterae.1